MIPRVTIADVAAAAGVSKATAHRALTTRRDVSAKTIAQVREIAGQLGYAPDPALSILARQRWHGSGRSPRWSLGLITSLPRSPRRGLFAEIGAVAAQHGYDLHDLRLDHFPSTATLMKRIQFEGMKGVIVIPGRQPDSRFHLDWDQVSAVSAGNGFESLPVPVIRLNFYESTLVALRRMRALGYRRIGAALPRDSLSELTPDDGRRRAAVLLFQQELGPGEEVIPPLNAVHHDESRLLEWVHRHRPDGILGFSAADFFRLRDAGIPVGDTVGYASLVVQPAEHSLSGLCLRPHSFATAVIQKLDSLIRCNIRGPQLPVEHTVVSSTWNEGDTLPSRTERALHVRPAVPSGETLPVVPHPRAKE